MPNRKVLKEKSPDLPGKAGLMNCYYGASRGLEATMRDEKRRDLEERWTKRLKSAKVNLFDI